MAEVIQFSCPACGASLRLPLAMAGIEGPCPLCHQEIIAPDPANGLDARIPVADVAGIPEPQEPEILEERSETESEPVAEESGVAAIPNRPPRRGAMLAALVLTNILSLAAGYFIGARSVCTMTMANSPPPVVVPPVAPSEPAAAEDPEPTAPEPAPEPQKDPQPVKVSAAAEAALRAFLDAPDWASRAAHVLTPDLVRSAMETYSHTVPDGPTAYQSISVENSYTDRHSGNTLFIFRVVTDAHPTGIPVAVTETVKGWLIDWQAFVEFRDDHFEAFAEGPVEQSGRFHLLVRTPPPTRAANTENKYFSSFLLEPPFPDQQHLAYVKKTSEIHAVLSAATSNGAIFTPYLEVAKRKAPDGKSYLEITGIIAHDWLPEGR